LVKGGIILRNDLRWKSLVIFALVLIFGLLLSPVGKNLFDSDPIRQGLDLKGGIELILSPDYRLGQNVLSKLGDDLLAKMRQASVSANMQFLGTVDNERYDGLQFTFGSPAEAERAINVGVFPSRLKFDFFGEIRNLNLDAKKEGNKISLTVLQDANDFPDDALQRSVAVIENRINEAAGQMAEADVRIDASQRINVQLPGIDSLKKAQEIIMATGRLTFRIDNKIVLDGSNMKEVGVSFHQGDGYVIYFGFKGDDAKQLAKVTAENVRKNMGVYLDEKELINPVIEEPLSKGEGIIKLGNTPKEEVEKYALLMKSGALPISLKIEQSTQVAPTLGKEIIKQSVFSCIIGIILVVLFMLLFYGMPGLMADFALIVYGVLVLGVMALFRGVLTLPGIAGFILSLGMAVDANIIIFERIKDELRNGKRVRAAVQGGFERAFVTILDSNITTLISAAVLFFLGNGPVKGFAVTLGLGVLISMFTAIFVTRVFLEWRIDRNPDRYAKHFGGKEVVQL
jgi:protein-export SecD/SecF family membrane protein